MHREFYKPKIRPIVVRINCITFKKNDELHISRKGAEISLVPPLKKPELTHLILFLILIPPDTKVKLKRRLILKNQPPFFGYQTKLPDNQI